VEILKKNIHGLTIARCIIILLSLVGLPFRGYLKMCASFLECPFVR
jgi:hypothetical protein